MMKFKKVCIIVLANALLFQGASLFSAEDEIQVYIDDMSEPGEFGIEVHTNHVLNGPTKPSFEGEIPTNRVTQFTPEFAYGITKNLEAGMYFPPLAVTSKGQVYENGIRLRLKYIADPPSNKNIFWGLNTEYGYSTRRVSETNWNLEFRPILGYKNNDWLISFNPILNTAMSGKNHTPEFEPCLKVGYVLRHGFMLGFEDYIGLGPTNNMTNLRQSENIAYLALDIAKGNLDINIGVGYGLSNTNEKGVIKMIFALPL